MKDTIQLHSTLPILQVLVVVVAAVALSIWLYRREERRGVAAMLLIALRTLSMASIGLILLNPVLVRGTEKPQGRTPLLVLIDTSHSMATQDVAGRSRLDAAKRAIFGDPDVMRTLEASHKTSYFSFERDAVRRDASAFMKNGVPNGSQTFIGESTANALSSAGSSRSGAVLIVSDGRDNGEISPTEIARQSKMRGFPVFTVCLGKETKTKDLSVNMNRPQVFTSPNQEVTIGGEISASGFEGGQAKVQLQREGKVVATKTVPIRPGGRSEVSFPVKEQAKGTYRYTFAVSEMPGEVTAANNKASSLLTVGNSTTRVLVLEGRPTWDAKFLIQALRSDPTLSVDSVFKLTVDRSFAVQGVNDENAPQKAEVKIPATRADFAKYDVVIVGKGFEEFFDDTSAKELQNYVSEDGGHLVFLRGRAAERSEALAALEPVSWSEDEVRDFRMKITDDGESNPAFGFGGVNDPKIAISRLPTLISATHVSQEKALAVVLARAQGANNADQPNKEMAVVAFQRYGEGLVLSLVGEGLWRWALLPPDLVDYNHCYNDFWTQMVRWMVNQSDFLPGQNLSLRTDHFSYSPGESVNLMVFVRGGKQGALSPLSITQPDGSNVKLTLSQAAGKQADYVGVFRPKLPGDYVASVSKPGVRGGQVTAPFSVFERRQEDLNTSADPALMKQIAKAGGGETLNLNQIKELPKRLKEVESTFLKKTEPQSIWDRWPILAAILGLLSLEWIVRRRMGMV